MDGWDFSSNNAGGKLYTEIRKDKPHGGGIIVKPLEFQYSSGFHGMSWRILEIKYSSICIGRVVCTLQTAAMMHDYTTRKLDGATASYNQGIKEYLFWNCTIHDFIRVSDRCATGENLCRVAVRGAPVIHQAISGAESMGEASKKVSRKKESKEGKKGGGE